MVVTAGRGRAIARFLSAAAGMVHVEVSDHYPVGDTTPEDQRVLFALRCPPPFGTIRVVPRHKLYTQRLWLLGSSKGAARIAIEGLPRGGVDDALVMMSARTFADLATLITEHRQDDLAVWRRRFEEN